MSGWEHRGLDGTAFVFFRPAERFGQAIPRKNKPICRFRFTQDGTVQVSNPWVQIVEAKDETEEEVWEAYEVGLRKLKELWWSCGHLRDKHTTNHSPEAVISHALRGPIEAYEVFTGSHR